MEQDWSRIDAAMDGPLHSLQTRLTREVRRMFAHAHVSEIEDPDAFDLDTFGERTGAVPSVLPAPDPRVVVEWEGPGHAIASRFLTGCREVEWDGVTHRELAFSWDADFRTQFAMYVVSPDPASAARFLQEVADVVGDVRAEVLVFNGSCWSRSSALWEAVQRASFDDLVLRPGASDALVADFQTFLRSREIYASHRLPWRRGVLFVGPPGNGKTHCIKALIRELELPTLYVQSFVDPMRGGNASQGAIAKVFDRARRVAPCLVVLEDLDTLVDDRSRAFLLAELDGLRDNVGVIVIASTNHPDRLDPALADRPSRFDRKIPFPLPGLDERARWLARWDTRAGEATRLGEDVAELARRTDGFSFAYLQELVVGALLEWMHAGSVGPVGTFALAGVDRLRGQMATPRVEPRPVWADDDA